MYPGKNTVRESVDPVRTTSLACVLTVCPGLFVQITWVSVLYKINSIEDGRIIAKKTININHLYKINSFLCNLQGFILNPVFSR